MLTRLSMGNRLRVVSLLFALALVAVVAVVGSAVGADAAAPPVKPGAMQATQTGQPFVDQQAGDGLDRLPLGYRATSMSALVSAGLVHPQPIPPIGKALPTRPGQLAPNAAISWGAEQCTSCPNDTTEPAASMHPSDPLFALVSGNFTVDRTTNGGTSWSNQNPAWPSGNGDVTNAWLPTSTNQDWAIGSSLNGCSPCSLAEGRTTNRGLSWTTVSSNISTPGFSTDRQYMFADQEPSSPFYGRVYLSQTLFDAAGSGSYNAVGLKFTSDMGN